MNSKTAKKITDDFFILSGDNNQPLDRLEVFLQKTGVFIGKNFTERQKKTFLLKLIDKIPWHFKKVVGEINPETGFSSNGFDMKILDDTSVFGIKFSEGYVKALPVYESLYQHRVQMDFPEPEENPSEFYKIKKWMEASKSGDEKTIKKLLALQFPPEAFFNNRLGHCRTSMMHELLALDRPDLFDFFLFPLSKFCGFDSGGVDSAGRSLADIYALRQPQRFIEKISVMPCHQKIAKNINPNCLFQLIVDHFKTFENFETLFMDKVKEYDFNRSGFDGDTLLHSFTRNFAENHAHEIQASLVEVFECFSVFAPLLVKKYKVRMDIVNKNEDTPYFSAIKQYPRKPLEVIKIFEECGENILALDKDRRNIAHIFASSEASSKETVSFVRIMKNKYQLDFNDKDKFGKTFLDYALENPSLKDNLSELLPVFLESEIDFKEVIQNGFRLSNRLKLGKAVDFRYKEYIVEKTKSLSEFLGKMVLDREVFDEIPEHLFNNLENLSKQLKKSGLSVFVEQELSDYERIKSDLLKIIKEQQKEQEYESYFKKSDNFFFPI